MSKHRLYLGIFGVADGTALANFDGYDGGELTDDAREALHLSLDHLVNVANSRARQSKLPRAHAQPRRR